MELLLNEIQKLINLDMNKILASVFSDKSLQTEILDRIRYTQLEKEGVSEENVIIGYYSPYTEQINPEKKAGTHYTLKDTGAFFASFTMQVFETYIVINADGEKTDIYGNTKDLFVVYNDRGNLIGLTDESMEWLIEKIIPMINERIETIL
jgi:hypothetical protein